MIAASVLRHWRVASETIERDGEGTGEATEGETSAAAGGTRVVGGARGRAEPSREGTGDATETALMATVRVSEQRCHGEYCDVLE